MLYGIVAVSYTHLDVYKRQGLPHILILQSLHHIFVMGILGDDMMDHHGVFPVSYTHLSTVRADQRLIIDSGKSRRLMVYLTASWADLDVYKRQGQILENIPLKLRPVQAGNRGRGTEGYLFPADFYLTLNHTPSSSPLVSSGSSSVGVYTALYQFV